MFVSVIIPVFNGGEEFREVLKAVMEQTYKNFEVVVVDDGSTDGSIEVAINFGAKVYSTGGRKGSNYARNLGAQKAKGEILVFLDADCKPVNTWLEEIVNNFKTGKVDVFTSSTIIVPRGFIGKYVLESFLSPSPIYGKSFVLKNDFRPFVVIATSNLAVRKSIFKEVGGFDEKFKWFGCDDMDIAYRILSRGFTIHCAPKPPVYHYYRTSLTRILKRYFQYGRGFTIYYRKHPNNRFSRIISRGMIFIISWYFLAIFSLIIGFPIITFTQLILAYTSLLLAYYKKFSKLRFRHIIYPILDHLLAFSSILGTVYQLIQVILSKGKY